MLRTAVYLNEETVLALRRLAESSGFGSRFGS